VAAVAVNLSYIARAFAVGAAIIRAIFGQHAITGGVLTLVSFSIISHSGFSLVLNLLSVYRMLLYLIQWLVNQEKVRESLRVTFAHGTVCG
jgi:hypothetical protein